MKNSIKLFNNELVLVNECYKNIVRYTNIINNYSTVNNHVYEKKSLYENKLITNTKKLEIREQNIITDTEKIILWIKKYTSDPDNYINYLATERYHILMSNDHNKNTNVESNIIKEKELSDEIDRIFKLEQNIKKDKQSTYDKDYYTFNSSCFYDYLSHDILEKENLEKIKDMCSVITNSLETIDESVKVINDIKKKIYDELCKKEKIFYDKRCELIYERVGITSDVKHIIQLISNLYEDFDENLKELFKINIPNILENKKLDPKNKVSGKKYLENYVELFHPEFKETFEKFIFHFNIVKYIYVYYTK